MGMESPDLERLVNVYKSNSDKYATPTQLESIASNTLRAKEAMKKDFMLLKEVVSLIEIFAKKSLFDKRPEFLESAVVSTLYALSRTNYTIGAAVEYITTLANASNRPNLVTWLVNTNKPDLITLATETADSIKKFYGMRVSLEEASQLVRCIKDNSRGYYPLRKTSEVAKELVTEIIESGYKIADVIGWIQRIPKYSTKKMDFITTANSAIQTIEALAETRFGFDEHARVMGFYHNLSTMPYLPQV